MDFAGCSHGEWQCRDGSCVASSARCNNIRECSDGSDEEYCQGKFVLQLLKMGFAPFFKSHSK